MEDVVIQWRIFSAQYFYDSGPGFESGSSHSENPLRKSGFTVLTLKNLPRGPKKTKNTSNDPAIIRVQLTGNRRNENLQETRGNFTIVVVQIFKISNC